MIKSVNEKNIIQQVFCFVLSVNKPLLLEFYGQNYIINR